MDNNTCSTNNNIHDTNINATSNASSNSNSSSRTPCTTHNQKDSIMSNPNANANTNANANNNNKTWTILSNLIEEAKRLKLEGNTHFTAQNYSSAEAAYSRGLKVVCSLLNHFEKKYPFVAFQNDGDEDCDNDNGNANGNDNDICSDNHNHNHNHNSQTRHASTDDEKEFLCDIIKTKVALWTNQAFVLNKLERYNDANVFITDALMEIQRRGIVDGIIIPLPRGRSSLSSSSSLSTTTDPFFHRIEQIVLSGLIKLQYRRAQARESLKHLIEAETDLKECLSIFRLSNKKQEREVRDIRLVLGRVQEQIKKEQGQGQGQGQEQEEEKNNQSALTQNHKCNNGENQNDISIEKEMNSKSWINNSTGAPSQQLFVDKFSQSNKNETTSCNTSFKGNDHYESLEITTSGQKKSIERNGQQNATQQQKQKGEGGGGGGESCNNKTSLYEICPSPEKQRSNILRLLSQSPIEGEAFFLIHYEWWRKWCQHVNLFLDYEYSRLLLMDAEQSSSSLLSSSETYNNQRERQQKQMFLEKERQNILQLLPRGARIPQVSYEGKTRKMKRSMSDDSSTNMESVDISIDEGDCSDSDSIDGEKMKYGPCPGVINNSQLIFQFPHSSKPNSTNVCDPSSLFYYEWSHRVKKEKTDHDLYILRPRLVHGHHFEILPREVYAALRCWYGESTPTIFRRASYSDSRNIQLILYPDLQWNDMLSPFRCEQSNSTNNFCGACKAINARLRCSNCASVYYCEQKCQGSHWPYHKTQCKALAWQKRQRGDMEEFVQQLTPDPCKDPYWGRVGLCNLGNTCFMNAALQCLSHAATLTRHFLTNRYRDDLNCSNPLGTGGKLANAYDIMIKEVWMNREKRAISPTALKRAIAMFAPRFSGMAQHDSQEFLAFLLDGLHEDLNRVKNPPYVEKPDVTNEQKLSVAGEESWDAHCLRNRSIVMDNFYGQFKSTCVCPKCERVSVSFDVFNHISLEIPQRRHDSTRIIAVLFFSSSPSFSTPIRYAVSVPKKGRIGDIKTIFSKMTKLPKERLALCDVYENSIYEIYNDDKAISSIEKDDTVVAYQIDPYSISTIHVISTHWKYGNLSRGEGQDPSPTRHMIGHPLLSSFGIGLSCREVWDHFYKRVSHILPKGDVYFHSFRLRLVDNNGKPRPVFGNMSSSEIQIDSIDSSSLIPKSDDKIAAFLGDDCAESFLFVAVEWDFSQKAKIMVDEKAFNKFVDDSSVMQAINKQRSMSMNITLENCLEQFTLPERLDEDNKWYCSACKKHVRAEKTMELWRLPNILIVHLKRFEFKHSLRREKLETLIDCPLEDLDMGKYCAQSSNDGHDFVVGDVPACYDLFAVVNHYGRMGFGHYTAFARRWTGETIENDWALFDDSSVRNGITKDQVVSSAAYVLFYRRRVFQ